MPLPISVSWPVPPVAFSITVPKVITTSSVESKLENCPALRFSVTSPVREEASKMSVPPVSQTGSTVSVRGVL